MSVSANINSAVRKVPAWPLYILGLTPAVWGFYLGATNQLGTDPVKTFEIFLGLWAVRFLLASLMVTPLRNLTRVNLIKYRRALGLLAFWYVLFHFLVWLILDQQLMLGQAIEDITKRPFIMLGMAALVLLIPLALTSFNFAIRKLRKGWNKLHGLIYVIAILAAIHLFMATKVLDTEQYIYLALFVVLLGYRLAKPPPWMSPARREAS